MLNTSIARPPVRTADPFYGSPPWKQLVARLISERGRRCENPECGRGDCRIFGDHMIEIQDGGALLDPLNIMLLCGSCHGIKTHVAKRIRESRGSVAWGL